MSVPTGVIVRLIPATRVVDGGAALVGGAPTRVMSLKPAARRLLADRTLRVSDRTSAALADRLLEAGMAAPILNTLPEADRDALTVVIPVHGRDAPLRRLLSALDGRVRVIVVDDASPRPEPIAAAAAHWGAELVRLDVNLGPGGARNAGLARVRTPLVAFVDADVVVDATALRLLSRHFADARVAAVAPRINGLGGAGPIIRYEDVRSSLDLGPAPGLVRPRSPVSWLPAACLIVRRGAAGGGFADDWRVAEDVDLVWRLAQAGWHVRYEPAVTAAHEHRARLGDWLRRKFYYGTGGARLAEQHGLDVAPAVLAPWSAGMLVALLAQRRWSVPVAAGLAMIAGAGIRRRLVGLAAHPTLLAARLTTAGVQASLAQAAALLVRHWWPLAAVGAAGSQRVRRALAIAAMTDAALEYARTDPALDPVRFALLRRLDDLAYGTGLWWGAIRARSLRALLPDVRRRRGRAEAVSAEAVSAEVVSAEVVSAKVVSADSTTEAAPAPPR